MPEVDYPKTVLVIHPKEKRIKCSLEPLRGRADLCFVEFSPQQPVELPGYVRLAVDGPPLTEADGEEDRGTGPEPYDACGALGRVPSSKEREGLHGHLDGTRGYADRPPGSAAYCRRNTW